MLTVFNGIVCGRERNAGRSVGRSDGWMDG